VTNASLVSHSQWAFIDREQSEQRDPESFEEAEDSFAKRFRLAGSIHLVRSARIGPIAIGPLGHQDSRLAFRAPAANKRARYSSPPLPGSFSLVRSRVVVTAQLANWFPGESSRENHARVSLARLRHERILSFGGFSNKEDIQRLDILARPFRDLSLTWSLTRALE